MERCLVCGGFHVENYACTSNLIFGWEPMTLTDDVNHKVFEWKEAPFTQSEIDFIVSHQLNKMMHPYTCAGCESKWPMIASKYGLECFYCGHKQTKCLVEVE